MELRKLDLLAAVAIILINCANEVEGEVSKASTRSRTLPDETVTGIILGAAVASFFLVLIVVVCVKEKCNRRRSVYHRKTKDSPKTESRGDIQQVENGISTISQSIK